MVLVVIALVVVAVAAVSDHRCLAVLHLFVQFLLALCTCEQILVVSP